MPTLADIIGAPGDITWWQMALRAVLVFLYLLLLIRLGDRRAFGRISAFDIVIGMILGSTLSRAITGNSPFGPTLVAAAVLVGLHALVGRLAKHFSWVGFVFKGRRIKLVEDGHMLRAAMSRTNITERDLKEQLRMRASLCELEGIKAAYLERSGEISFIKKEPA